MLYLAISIVLCIIVLVIDIIIKLKIPIRGSSEKNRNSSEPHISDIDIFLKLTKLSGTISDNDFTLFKDPYSKEEYDYIQEIKHKKETKLPVTINDVKSLKPVLDIYRFKIHLSLPKRNQFITMLNFITEFSKPNDTILILGSFDEFNLSNLFPDLTFKIYDDGLEKLSSSNLLFIGLYDGVDLTVKYKKIIHDLNPRVSQIEVCIDTLTNYLDGEIRFGPWMPIDVYIGFLIIHQNANNRVYDNIAIKSKLCYFNIILREYSWYHHNISTFELPGLCHCFDCTYEINTWHLYLARSKSNKSVIDYMKIYNRLGNLNSPPHVVNSNFVYDIKDDFRKYYYNFINKTMLDRFYSDSIEKSNDIMYNEELFKNILIKEQYTPNEIKEIIKVGQNHSAIKFLITDIPATLNFKLLSKNRNLYRIHLGQRKLLMNEIIFLTKYATLSNLIVYAGAAPGIHIPFLLELFPKLKFELWDPAPFAIKENNRIKIYNDYFTNESAKKYIGQNILFVSDIRSGSDKMSYEEFEKQVEINNNYQVDWINIIKPIMSMLKFRIPFTIKEKYNYFDGTIYLQPWAPIDSAETRLITDGKKMILYDPLEYENKLYYFNNIVREYQFINHNIQTINGICHCFDCSYEIDAWKNYITTTENKNDINAEIFKYINKTNYKLKNTLHYKHHGNMPDLYMSNKRYFLFHPTSSYTL